MWRRIAESPRVWLVMALLGALLAVGEIALAVFGPGAAWPHLLRSVIWVVLAPLWFARSRKLTRTDLTR